MPAAICCCRRQLEIVQILLHDSDRDERCCACAQTTKDWHFSGQPCSLDPTEDGSALRVSFTIPNKALKQSDLIGALLQRGEGFSIEASTPGVLVWMADKLEGGSEPTSTLENARDQQTLAMLQVRNGPKQQ